MAQRTIYYVDGLNLYKRCVSRSGHKWLDLAELFRRELPEQTPTRIRYFTALVDSQPDPGARSRQRTYLTAIKTLQGLTIHHGTMRTDQASMSTVVEDGRGPEVAVWHTREKGSDVNLAAYLFYDLATSSDTFDAIVIVTHDSDQATTIRLAREVTEKPIGVLDPSEVRAKHLYSLSSFYRNIHTRAIRDSQLPDEVPLPRGGVARRPPEWD